MVSFHAGEGGSPLGKLGVFASILIKIEGFAEGTAKDLRLLPVGGTGTRGKTSINSFYQALEWQKPVTGPPPTCLELAYSSRLVPVRTNTCFDS